MPDSTPKRLLDELKRRKVFRAAGVYLVVGWASIEVTDTVAPLMGLPDWVPRLVLFLVLLGFPLTLAISWAVDITPDGVRPAEVPGREHGSAPAAALAERVNRLAGRVLVGLGLVAAVAAGGWYLLGSGSRPSVEVDRSVAVLPFETLGAEQTSAFTEGVHAGILTRLSSVSGLDVISRTSVLRYATGARPIPEIAGELGVGWVLGGEVQEVGDQVLVNVRLVDARKDRQVWAENYRRRLTAENVFHIQAEIAKRIIAELQGHLSAGEAQRVEQAPTQNLQAYRLYVQGRRVLDHRDEGMARGPPYFRRAIEEDSTYALAWVGLADALMLMVSYGYSEPGEALPEAERAIRRALELDPQLAEAHASAGLLHEAHRRGTAAIRELERAVDLRPSYGEAHNWLAWLHVLVGNGESALVSARRALKIDPLHAEALSNLVNSLIATGRLEDAVIEAERGRELYPSSTDLRMLQGVASYQAGRYEEAKRVLDGLSQPWAGYGPALTLALANLASGDTAAARETLARFEREEAWFGVGVLRTALGEEERAFEAFDRVEDWGEYWPTLSVHHFYPRLWDRLEGDPRYHRIRRQVERAWGA